MGRTHRDSRLLAFIGTIATIATTSFLNLGPVHLPSWVTGMQSSNVDAATARPLDEAGPPFTVTPGDHRLTVSWPLGTPWSRYRVDALNEKNATPEASCRPVNNGASLPPSCVLSGLHNGFPYLVSVLPTEGDNGAIPVRMVHATPRPDLLASKHVALWLDPSDLTTIQAAQKGPAHIGSKVMVLRDKSAHHTAASQSDNGFMPTVGQLGPLPAMLLNGRQLLGMSQENLPLGDKPSTVIVVAAQDDTNGELTCFHNLLAWGGAQFRQARIIHKGCNTSMAFAETFGTFVNQKPTLEWPTGKAAVLSAVFEARSIAVRVNGAQSYQWSAPPEARMNTAKNTSAIVGGVAWDVQGGWVGRLGDVIVFDRVLTTEELTSVEGFLAAKWRLPILVAN